MTLPAHTLTAHDLVTQAKAQINEVDVDNAQAALDAADAIIDVREPDEFAAGHLPNAINIPRGLLEFKLAGLPELESRDSQLVLYCKTSGRAALAALSLQTLGYQQVQSINGGFDAWLAADKPIVLPTADIDFD